MSAEEGSVFLGVPMGGPAFTENHFYAVAEEMQALLTKLSHLDHSLSMLLILRASFSARHNNHLLRALPFLVG